MRFSSFLSESYLIERAVNLFVGQDAERKMYAQQVFDMLQAAYADIGGIHGSGFASPEDMMAKIPMWKLAKKGGKIVAGTLYKDKEGRKVVASFTDGTSEGKAELSKFKGQELNRSYGEVSKGVLGLLVKTMGVERVKQLAHMPFDLHKKLMPDDEFRAAPADDSHMTKFSELAPYFYQRKVGGHWDTKILVGTPGNRITSR